MPRFVVVVFALAAVVAAVWIVRGSDPGDDVSRWNDAPATPERHPDRVRIPGGAAHTEGIAAERPRARGDAAADAGASPPFDDPDALAAELGKGSAPGVRSGTDAPGTGEHRLTSSNAPSVAGPSVAQPAPEAPVAEPAAPDVPPDLDLEAQVAALAESRHLLTPAQIDQRTQQWLRRNGLTPASASPADLDRARQRVLSDQAIAVELANARYGADAPAAQKQPTIDLAHTLLPYQTQAWRNEQMKKVLASSAESGS